MREIFNRDAVITTALMLTIFAALWVVLHFTDNTEALQTCGIDNTFDVCMMTINP